MTSPLAVVLREARALIASAASALTAEPGEAAVARRLVGELDQTIARLEGHDADKDLVSIVCHDLKDPLASIVMGAGFLRKTIPRDDGASRRVVDAIARSAERMGQVVTDFHDLAKLEAGRLEIDARTCDVAGALEAAIVPLKVQSHERGIELELEIAKAPLVATCDRGRLVQMAGKLLGNAIKFTPAGGRITVRAEMTDEHPIGKAVRIAITDTGKGIPPDRLSTIFDRVANSRRMPRDGPGLGLAIVKGLVDLHRGRVTVESTEGRGSQFVLTFPAPP